MSIANFLSKFSQKNSDQEIFLALEISQDAVKSAVWTIENHQTVVIKVGSMEPWDEAKKDSLILASDTSLSKASEGLAKEPNKVILGLPEEWVKNNEIQEDKKAILKNLCTKLALKPLGFVVVIEAILAYLKQKEGTPISAIFINLGEIQSIVSLTTLGKLKGSETVGRSDDLASDVREALARFGETGNLPSRMILFNGMADFEDAKQQLMSYDWIKEMQFLHFPKVRSLDSQDSIKAVALAGGAEVAKSLGFEIIENEEQPKTDGIQGEAERSHVAEAPTKAAKEALTAADMGFFQEQDIKDIKPKDEVIEVAASGSDRSISDSSPFVPPSGTTADKDLGRENVDLSREKVTGEEFKDKIKAKVLNFLAIFKKFSLPKNNLSTSKPSTILILALVFLVILALAGFAYYWYVPKAEVNIYLRPRILEKDLEINVDTTTTVLDKDKIIIPGILKVGEIEGKQSTKTTGEKIVGEKAKGQVTIYNKTSVAKNFPKSAVLIGPNNLTFTLDDSVTIASQSAQLEGITFGKANANITASSIGTESNLAQQSQFTFKEYSSNQFSAKTEAGLSGGTSRQIKAVSKDDMLGLLKSLSDELIIKQKEQLKGQLAPEEELLDKEVKTEIVDKKYSAAENDEVDDLSLNLKLRVSFLAYKKENLNLLAQEMFKNNIPSDFSFKADNLDIQVLDVVWKDNKAKLQTHIKANLLPNLNIAEIKTNLKGKYPSAVQDYLNKIPQFLRADIKITPTLPLKLNTLPRSVKNININIQLGQ